MSVAQRRLGPEVPRRETVQIHGNRVTYRLCGSGPPLVLLHGIAGSSETWVPLMPALAREHTVIAPDMLGHGASAKPRGDYSLGAYASGVRDLMIALGHERATVVGHSLGGGIAMQFGYQFPERLARLVLVSSGGLGREVSVALRAATLPGADLVLSVLCGPGPVGAATAVGRVLGRLGLRAGPDLSEVAHALASFSDAAARRAFLHTIGSTVDIGGQRVSARDRLYLAAEVPTLLVWGENDPIIPAAHGRAAHDAMPGSRLEVFAGAGHFPHLDDPARFVAVLNDFLESTEPAEIDPERIRALLLGEQLEPSAHADRARARPSRR